MSRGGAARRTSGKGPAGPGERKAPPEHAAATPPRERAVSAPPRGGVPAAQRPSHPPPERQVASPPNPRRPAVVRDVHGNELKDLFVVFPDLPRPRKVRSRFPVRLSRALKLR